MDKKELIEKILEAVRDLPGVDGASLIDGEDVVGFEVDGVDYFLELKEA